MKHNIITINEFVNKLYGGKCLSDKYATEHNGKKIKLLWQCSFGHIWEATADCILHRHQWCPYCSSGLYERICREYFEQLFGNKFPKTRPQWLKNSRNNIMELDGYCNELNLAFEHNGKQHYSESKQFKTNIKQRIEDDKLKHILCKEHNIFLIEIPELFTFTKFENLRKVIKDFLLKNNIIIPNNFDTIQIDLKKAYSNEEFLRFEQIKTFANSKNGKVLSEEYYGWHSCHMWKCNVCNYEWFASPHNIINGGTWCPKCAKKAIGTIEEMKKLAINKNGVCLSDEYINCKTKLTWQCNKCQYIWEATPIVVKNLDCWCPKCAGQGRPTMEYIKSLAETHGGKCLNPEEYKRSGDKLKWECQDGHIFEACYSNVRAGKWCPKHRKGRPRSQHTQ